MQEGVVIRGYSGFYYVQVNDAIWECSLRGRLRQNRQKVLPGDRVKVTWLKKDKGVVEEVLPRRSELIRPPIANVDQVVIVMALSNPEPNLKLLDRLLILVEHEQVKPVICLSKADLVNPTKIAPLERVYQETGYPVVVTSATEGRGLEALREHLTEKISVLAGPSGVGKSTLLNAIQPGLSLKTAPVSPKIGRGRHTTRHVELLPLTCGGLVADTPGFSILSLPKMKREELVGYFPDLSRYVARCRFSSCLHAQEPDCAVKQALAEGKIDTNRYRHYLEFLAEVIANEQRY